MKGFESSFDDLLFDLFVCVLQHVLVHFDRLQDLALDFVELLQLLINLIRHLTLAHHTGLLIGHLGLSDICRAHLLLLHLLLTLLVLCFIDNLNISVLYEVLEEVKQLLLAEIS